MNLMEKIAANNSKPRKKKPAGGRKPRDIYAPDMSNGAPGTRKEFKGSQFTPDKKQEVKKKLSSKKEFDNKSFKSDTKSPKPQTLQGKKEFSNKGFKPSPSKAPVKKPAPVKAPKKIVFKPKRLGLAAAGLAGVGYLAHKARSIKAGQEAK